MAVCFDSDHFGCPGCAFHLGFFKPMLESTIQFVSTGSEERPGELYLSSPDVAKMYFDTLDPQPTEMYDRMISRWKELFLLPMRGKNKKES